MDDENKIATIFDQLWDAYYQQNPQVPAITSLISEQENKAHLTNDHIAIRTLQHPNICIDNIAKTFTSLGFIEREQFLLQDKHVFAKYFSHPSQQWPRIFISELIISELSENTQLIIKQIINQIPSHLIKNGHLYLNKRPWKISHQDYLCLLKENEYAAWVTAHGFQMNHATLSVNHMKKFSTLEELNSFLQQHNVKLNGEKDNHVIQQATDNQGKVVLKQSSTIASTVNVNFSDGIFNIPGCYYEFIERFHGYDSFDPGNASKIMESTNVR